VYHPPGTRFIPGGPGDRLPGPPSQARIRAQPYGVAYPPGYPPVPSRTDGGPSEAGPSGTSGLSSNQYLQQASRRQ
jgi:hypothetical protein